MQDRLAVRQRRPGLAPWRRVVIAAANVREEYGHIDSLTAECILRDFNAAARRRFMESNWRLENSERYGLAHWVNRRERLRPHTRRTGT